MKENTIKLPLANKITRSRDIFLYQLIAFKDISISHGFTVLVS